MSNKSDICIVVPAFNEGSNIGNFLNNIPSNFDVVVVNDCSTDNTDSIVKQHEKILINHFKNLGYDKAIQTGINYAINNNYKYAITMDSDGQHDPKLIDVFISEFNRGANIIIGKREFVQRWAEVIVSTFGQLIWNVKDPLCGMKGYRIYKNMNYFNLNYNSVGMEFAIRYIKKRENISQPFIKINERSGESTFGNGLRVNLLILNSLLFCVINYLKNK